jgi:hypothetical protein
MPVNQHLVAAFLLTTVIAMIAPGPGMLLIGLGARWPPGTEPPRGL